MTRGWSLPLWLPADVMLVSQMQGKKGKGRSAMRGMVGSVITATAAASLSPLFQNTMRRSQTAHPSLRVHPAASAPELEPTLRPSVVTSLDPAAATSTTAPPSSVRHAKHLFSSTVRQPSPLSRTPDESASRDGSARPARRSPDAGHGSKQSPADTASPPRQDLVKFHGTGKPAHTPLRASPRIAADGAPPLDKASKPLALKAFVGAHNSSTTPRSKSPSKRHLSARGSPGAPFREFSPRHTPRMGTPRAGSYAGSYAGSLCGTPRMTSLEQRILHTEVAQLGTTDAEDNVRRLMAELEGQDNEIVDALNHQRELRKQRRVRGLFCASVCASAHRVAVLMRVLHQRLLRRRQRELARHREQLQAQRAAPTTEDTITEEDEALVDAER